jgi:hypothetical protein
MFVIVTDADLAVGRCGLIARDSRGLDNGLELSFRYVSVDLNDCVYWGEFLDCFIVSVMLQ